ncbi:MAG: TSUP family transporter [Lachnospiraceae bacterium]|nr:TSUP family transporter [Lachnospiraceae bacterium]
MFTPKALLIICPLVFLAGLLDSIAGGGALISIPAYLIAGVPIHSAIATNKLSASFGAAISLTRFMKNKLVNLKLGIPSIAFAILGSALGANLSMRMDGSVMVKAMYIILPLAAFVVLNKKVFHDHPERELTADFRTFTVVMSVAFVIGVYDGFFGPGAGTFSIICLNIFGKMNIANANAQTKLINMVTTLTALIVFLMNAQVLIPLGILAGLCNILGSYIGSGLVITGGSRITKMAMILVLVLLAVKIAGVY